MMKKIIITLCSLALSLAGSYGINQLALKDKDIMDKYMKRIIIEQPADETEEKSDMPADKEDKAVTDDTAKEDKKACSKDTADTGKSGKDDKKQGNTANNKDSNSKAGSSYKISGKTQKSTGNAATPPKNKGKTPNPSKSANDTTDQSRDKGNSTTSAKSTGNTSTDNTSSSKSYAEEVLRLVNIEREKAGLPALTTNSELKAAADKRAQEIKASFSHTRPDGSKFSTVLKEYGISFRTAGENIAYGQRSPQEVVNAWMNSPGHRANILNSSFGKIGIGVYQSGGVIYWTQLFTN
jgi:uncharacterized protein YkwD